MPTPITHLYFACFCFFNACSALWRSGIRIMYIYRSRLCNSSCAIRDLQQIWLTRILRSCLHQDADDSRFLSATVTLTFDLLDPKWCYVQRRIFPPNLKFLRFFHPNEPRNGQTDDGSNYCLMSPPTPGREACIESRIT